jgi:hypothetical protein
MGKRYGILYHIYDLSSLLLWFINTQNERENIEQYQQKIKYKTILVLVVTFNKIFTYLKEC